MHPYQLLVLPYAFLLTVDTFDEPSSRSKIATERSVLSFPIKTLRPDLKILKVLSYLNAKIHAFYILHAIVCVLLFDMRGEFLIVSPELDDIGVLCFINLRVTTMPFLEISG